MKASVSFVCVEDEFAIMAVLVPCPLTLKKLQSSNLIL